MIFSVPPVSPYVTISAGLTSYLVLSNLSQRVQYKPDFHVIEKLQPLFDTARIYCILGCRRGGGVLISPILQPQYHRYYIAMAPAGPHRGKRKSWREVMLVRRKVFTQYNKK